MRKKPAKSAVFYPDLELLRQAQVNTRKRSPLASFLFLVCLCFCLLAVARPQMPVRVVDPLAEIMIAIDTSRSMQQTDIQPNRFEAAREAIRTFVKTLPEGTKIGLVSFGRSGRLNIAPTDNHEQFLRVLNTMPQIRGTAIGSGILKSLEELPVASHDKSAKDQTYGTIILLSDGNNRHGVHPLDVLDEVKAQGVKVYTVGIGTRTVTDLGPRASFDERTLETIANETGGYYSFVDSADELVNLYKNLSQALAWRWDKDEASALFSLVAAFLLMTSLSLAAFKKKL